MIPGWWLVCGRMDARMPFVTSPTAGAAIAKGRSLFSLFSSLPFFSFLFDLEVYLLGFICSDGKRNKNKGMEEKHILFEWGEKSVRSHQQDVLMVHRLLTASLHRPPASSSLFLCQISSARPSCSHTVAFRLQQSPKASSSSSLSPFLSVFSSWGSSLPPSCQVSNSSSPPFLPSPFFFPSLHPSLSLFFLSLLSPFSSLLFPFRYFFTQKYSREASFCRNR